MGTYPGVILLLLVSVSLNSRPTYQQDSKVDELYSETPCELRPLSAYRDIQSNLWGIGDGNLWWFNSTNLSWSLLPLPNGTSLVEPWRVACGDPKRYVALISATATLILHLPWQHWQQVDTDDVNSGRIDSFATWCKSGILYAADSLKTNIYILDHEEARWTLLSETAAADASNRTHTEQHTTGNVSRTWILPNGDFVLAGSRDSCDHIMISNSSALGWTMLAQRSKSEAWPNLNGQVIAWVKETNSSNLWLWIKDNEVSVWSFDLNEQLWKDATKTVPPLPKVDDILTSWVDGNQLCLLKRTDICSAQYSSSSTICWDRFEENFSVSSKTLDLPTDASTYLLVKEGSESQSTTSLPIMVIPETPKPMILSAHTVINKHSLLSALQSEVDGIDSSDDIAITAALPSKHNPWHQHTSVFGSVIFFGTSLTIFGVVGSFWCIKRCVHFPKEALLLRDPPSVRYTAIPDNLPFDSRGQCSTAYTVIPDSIA